MSQSPLTAPLDAAKIVAGLTPAARDRLAELEVHREIASTNSALLERPVPPAGRAAVCLAEYQSAGRGRRGRVWLAPPAGAICLSVSWTFQSPPADVAALGLCVGVCALRALRALGLDNVQLKWPNDLLVSARKIGGILIDLRADATGPTYVVIGLGLNLELGAALLEEVARLGGAATDLRTAGLKSVERNSIIATLLDEILRGMPEFERASLRPFIDEWRAADALHGRMVDVQGIGATARGVARGIDIHGALMVETPRGIRRFVSGDITVRAG